jgi:hypothetical protein
MPGSEYQGMAPWVVVLAITLSAVLAWVTQARMYRTKRDDEKADEKKDNARTLEIHRDELTFELLQSARTEMQSARIEVEELRDEVRKLRSMENHFYHFQQSLEHLEALLFANSPEERAVAEHNARAFLNRMKRLQDAKGTISNEAQRAASVVHLLGDDPVVNPKGGNNG